MALVEWCVIRSKNPVIPNKQSGLSTVEFSLCLASVFLLSVVALTELGVTTRLSYADANHQIVCASGASIDTSYDYSGGGSTSTIDPSCDPTTTRDPLGYRPPPDDRRDE